MINMIGKDIKMKKSNNFLLLYYSFQINPMYSSRGEQNTIKGYEKPKEDYGEERKVYANTLK